MESTEYLYWIDDADAYELKDRDFTMPKKLDITQGVAEKIRMSREIYENASNMEMLSSMMLDVSSSVPGTDICNYMRAFYFQNDDPSVF